MSIVWSSADRFVKWRLAAVLPLIAAGSVLVALGPVALKGLLDGFAGGARNTASPLFFVVAYVTSQLLARAVSELRGLVYARAERRLVRVVSGRLFAHILRLPLRFHLDRKTGAVSKSLEDGITGFQQVLHHVIFTFLPVTAELGTMIVVLLRLAGPRLLLLFCGALICYGAAFAHAAKTVARSANGASSAQVKAAAQMTDGMLNVELVKYFAAEAVIEERLDRALSRTENEWASFYRRYTVSGLIVSTIFASFLAICTLYAVRQVEVARLTVGDFVLITTYMVQVVRPVEALGYAVQAFSQGAAMLKKMLALFHEKSEPRHTGEAVVPAAPAQLEFENVTLSYEPHRPALRGVSFRVPAGATVGIVGASGSGKSTLVRLAVRLLEPDSGRILLDGVPISSVSLASLRRSIAIVPQVMFNDSVGGNIAFGKAGCTAEEIEEAARSARIHEFIAGLPDTYGTPVGERGLKLSGGERQRVSIARAAIKRPRIYIFDEATSALDSATELEIVRNLREVSKSITTLVITHRLATIAHADEIIVLEQGRVAERGTHCALLQLHGRYAALWAAQLASLASLGLRHGP